MFNFAGMPIIANAMIPDIEPAIELSGSVTVSPEFRNEYDDWLLETFGYSAKAYCIDNTLFMNPDMLTQLLGVMNMDSN